MIKIKKYVKAESLEQAYELNQKRNNRVLGGMLWLKMGRGTIQNVIDLSGVVSDQIAEQEDAFIIGAMASLRALETHPGLNAYTNGAVKESLCHIVGVQFRNMATLGGSVYGRFGFSDVLTMLLALDTYVELYKGGILPLEEYAKQSGGRDIVVNIIIKKTPMQVAYLSSRNAKTDFPTLACAVSFQKGERRVVIGARPQRAAVFRAEESILAISKTDEKLPQLLADWVETQVITGGNMRGSAEYRKHLVKVLTKRACLQILERGRNQNADKTVD